MAYNVKFLKGTLANYNAIEVKDKNTFYYIDESDLYLGDILLSSADDVADAVERIEVNEQSIKNLQAELDALVDPEGTGSGSISSQIAELRTQLLNKIDDNTELINAEVERAKKAEGDLQKNINDVDGELSTLQGTVGEHATSIGTLTTDLSNLTTEVSTNKNTLLNVRDDVGELKPKVETLETTVGTHTTQLAKLIGSDADKSIREIALSELAEQLIPDNAQEAMDTLEELAAWLQSHPTEAAQMNESILQHGTAIENLQTSVGTNSESIIALQELVEEINDTETGILATAKKYTDDEIDKIELALEGYDEAIAAINNSETGILALAKKYTDDEIDAVNDALGELETLANENADAIAAINNTQTGILAVAKENIDQAIANLKLGTAAQKNIEDFDAAGSATAALNNAKEYTDNALTWGVIEQTEQ